LDAARNIVEKVPVEVMRQVPPFEGYAPTLLYTLARFSKWDEILKQPAPPSDLRYATAAWHYARGLAYTGQGKPDSAAVERDSLVVVALSIPAARMVHQNSARAVLQVAIRHLAGEMAARAGRTDLAVQQLGRAVSLEDELTYEEPPAWYMPMRQRLGAVLLAAGRPRQAEKVYRADLVHRPENGWSLYGLAQSLKAQNRTKEAAKVEDRFEKAWKKPRPPFLSQ
jgi:tetratricopeptide (TPR) repeat protein